MWVTGAASSMWPIRSRRTLARVTSTPHLSQMMPLYRTLLYLPHEHSVLRGTENPLADKTVTLGLERTVVDRLRLRHFAPRPGANLLRRGERDAHRVEVINL